MIDTKGRPTARGHFAASIILFVVWIAASRSFDPASLIVGLAVSLAIAGAAARYSAFWSGLDFRPARMIAVLAYLWRFAVDIIKSNLAVLGYVYAPKVDIAGRIISCPVTISGPRERLGLTSTLALTPGSLAIDLDGERLEIHLLDRKLETDTRAAVARFETLLERAVG